VGRFVFRTWDGGWSFTIVPPNENEALFYVGLADGDLADGATNHEQIIVQNNVM